MSHILGRNCKLYYNAGTYNSPTWTEVTLAKDLTLNLDAVSADADHRAAGVFGAEVVAKLNAAVDFEVIRDTANAVFLVLEAAYYALTQVEFLILDGAVGTTGSRGVRALCQLHKWTRSETLQGMVIQQAQIKPTYAPNAAANYTVA